MSKQVIGLGTVPNDDTGDDLRVGGDKVNDNFDELYNALGDGTDLNANLEPFTTAEQSKLSGLMRSAEEFGVVATAHGGTPTDNLTEMQAAIDWSASNGGVVVLPHGEVGFDGTLDLKANASIVGQGQRQSTLIQMDTTWPDCLVPSHADGNGENLLAGFTLDGGWDKKASAGVGNNWEYTSSSLTQIGIEFSCPTGGPTQTRDGTSDMQSRLIDMGIRNIAGVGFSCAGRGEIMVSKVQISTIANEGMIIDAADNFFHMATVSVTGNSGIKITEGNQRLTNCKFWFNGMKVNEQADAAFWIQGSSVAAVIASSIMVQDSWGQGMLLEGNSHNIHGSINEAHALQVEHGFGNTTLHSDPAVLEVGNMDDSYINLACRDRQDNTATILPALVRFSSAGSTLNVIHMWPRLTDWTGASPTFYDTNNPIDTTNGYNNANRHNLVYMGTDRLIHGTVTATDLSTSTRDLNKHILAGARALRDDYVWMMYDGTNWLANPADDTAYGAGWNGSVEAPTKNAVYDKIESIPALTDGDKGDITVSASGLTWTVDAVAQGVVTAHQTSLTLTESQISDLQAYLLNVANDTTPQLGGLLDLNNFGLGFLATNNTGSTINTGDPVYMDGNGGIVAPADADGSGTMPCVGVAGEDITSGGGTGIVVTHGFVTDLDTSAYSANDPLYVTTAGALSDTAPTTGTIQEVARVVTSHASTGIIHVDMKTAGRPLNDDASMNDVNGNEVLQFGVVSSAVNHLKLTNAVTGNPVPVEPAGGDTNIDLDIRGKGTGRVKLDEPQAIYRIYEVTTAGASAHTLVAADQDSIIEMNNASAQTLTIPANATEAFPVGSSFTAVRMGAGVVTIEAASGVTLQGNGGSAVAGSCDILTQYGMATFYKRATDIWVISGIIDAVS